MARVALCQDALIEYMGYMQMSAVLKQDGHEVEVFFDDQMHPDAFVDTLRRWRPDVVAFSVLTPSRAWADDVARRLRTATSAAPVLIAGNVDVIMSPDAYVGGPFDLLCTGEGEDVMSELCAAIDGGTDWDRLTGTWSLRDGQVHRNPKRPSLVDMDALPCIDRDLYDKYRFFRRSPYLKVYAGRGCPFRCSFCANTNLTDEFGGAKAYIRKAAPEQFVAHIEALVASRPNRIRHLFIIDEVLWLDRPWLHRFLELYRDRVGIPFSMNFKFNGGVTEADIELMAAAGASGVCVATETGDEGLRRGLLNKPVSDRHILEVTGWMHKHGLVFGSSAFFGLPGQTFEGHLAELAFYRKVRPNYLWTTFFQPYPGLKLTGETSVDTAVPAGAGFDATVHNDMYLDLPDRTRLVNLKKVYHLLYRHPRLERPLAALCRYRIPLLFDALFAVHFLAHVLWWEGCSLYQFSVHVRNFVINPALRRSQPLNGSGRPFDIGMGPPGPDGSEAPADGRADAVALPLPSVRSGR